MKFTMGLLKQLVRLCVSGLGKLGLFGQVVTGVGFVVTFGFLSVLLVRGSIGVCDAELHRLLPKLFESRCASLAVESQPNEPRLPDHNKEVSIASSVVENAMPVTVGKVNVEGYSSIFNLCEFRHLELPLILGFGLDPYGEEQRGASISVSFSNNDEEILQYTGPVKLEKSGWNSWSGILDCKRFSDRCVSPEARISISIDGKVTDLVFLDLLIGERLLSGRYARNGLVCDG